VNVHEEGATCHDVTAIAAAAEATGGAALGTNSADRTYSGNRRGPRQDTPSGRQSGAANLSAQNRQRGLLIRQRQRPHRLSLRRLRVFLSNHFAIDMEFAHHFDSSEGLGRLSSAIRN
jgi:hypothetical protein